MPAQLGGNALGVLIAPVLPATIVESLACVLLLYAALKTLKAAIKSFRRESQQAADHIYNSVFAAPAQERARHRVPRWVRQALGDGSERSTAAG